MSKRPRSSYQNTKRMIRELARRAAIVRRLNEVAKLKGRDRLMKPEGRP
jgi:hypothetical protein